MQLKFSPEGKFKVLQFTDIHFSKNNHVDEETTRLMAKLLKEEQPDFVMITGDTVYGEHNQDHLPLALQPVVDSGIPFSFTFGNHDTEHGVGYEELYAILDTIPTCLISHDPSSKVGKGNHMLEVVGADGVAKWIIVGVDSGNYSPMQSVGGYAYVKTDQIEWYKDKIKAYETQLEDFSALVFMHIPLPEYQEVWMMETCYGTKLEKICSPRVNTGFFAAMQEVGHTKGVFAGHDHINDFYGELYGITLGYGRATGYNTYGREGFLRGARVFVLDANDTKRFDTYVRLSDGTVIDQPDVHEPEFSRDNL